MSTQNIFKEIFSPDNHRYPAERNSRPQGFGCFSISARLQSKQANAQVEPDTNQNADIDPKGRILKLALDCFKKIPHLQDSDQGQQEGPQTIAGREQSLERNVKPNAQLKEDLKFSGAFDRPLAAMGSNRLGLKVSKRLKYLD